eukprot:TRINITY_DN247_c0_g1_i4.p1 TRINITY_DN247_c0_g1~~TRINITY_DN247_c0_g1_i4.p1  ORF type:complete len:131 (-),score=2.38 TRINITY_DN247_c0_g1_i4:336-728(-)
MGPLSFISAQQGCAHACSLTIGNLKGKEKDSPGNQGYFLEGCVEGVFLCKRLQHLKENLCFFLEDQERLVHVEILWPRTPQRLQAFFLSLLLGILFFFLPTPFLKMGGKVPSSAQVFWAGGRRIPAYASR